MSLKKYLTEAELAAVQPITGDEFDINIREITNIETVVLEHSEGSITIALDETAIKMLEHCGCTFEEDEEEQIDELAPLIGAVGGALARGAVAGAGALARGAAKTVVGTGIKAAHDKLDKKLFGPKPAEGDYEYEESMREQDDEGMEDYVPNMGDVVRVDYPTAHDQQLGQVVEISPSGDFAYVQFKDGTIESYHGSDLVTVSDDEAEEYFYKDDDFEESMNDILRLSGVAKKEAIREEGYDKSPGGPYDRGAADSYYGRDPKPHKVVPYTGADGVKGQMQKVLLTDPAEIAAYNAGYGENDDRKDWGESVNEAEYQGRKVQLGKPMQGDVKKFKVYVKDPSTGNVKKVNFGDPNMRIRKSNPGARKNFRARHNCKNPGPRTKARYWSCRKW
jgi:hypothetical protein